MKKEIEITKDNYEDYVKLYDRRTTYSDLEQQRYVKIWLSSVFIPIFAICPVGLISIEILKMLIEVLCAGTACFNLIFGGIIICDRDHEKRVNKEFPNINTEIETKELKKILEKVHIITKGKIDVAAYENNLKCEQIKEKMLEEDRREEYDTSISEEELQRIKGKVKKLVKTR